MGNNQTEKINNNYNRNYNSNLNNTNNYSNYLNNRKISNNVNINNKINSIDNTTNKLDNNFNDIIVTNKVKPDLPGKLAEQSFLKRVQKIMKKTGKEKNDDFLDD